MFLKVGRETLSLSWADTVMSSTLLALRQRKRACRVQYESVEFVDAGCRQTATNAKMAPPGGGKFYDMCSRFGNNTSTERTDKRTEVV